MGASGLHQTIQPEPRGVMPPGVKPNILNTNPISIALINGRNARLGQKYTMGTVTQYPTAQINEVAEGPRFLQAACAQEPLE